MMKKSLQYSKYLVIAALLYMPLFGHLDTLPIRVWDEARLAMNAYEMYENGNYLVTHYLDQPDMWNTKPPLLIWMQVFFMKILGVNELAVRLPSALAGFTTMLALLIFAQRYLKRFWFGFIAVIVLLTTQGYVAIHGSRTGDYDTLLTLFTTLSGLLFFAYCEARNSKYLYLFFLFTALAVLTKSVTGLLFLPALFIYSLIRKQFLPLLKSKHLYLGILGFISLVGGFYLLREHYNPGYLTAVYQNELGGRFVEGVERHQHTFWYYFDNLISFRFNTWYLLLPCGLVFGFVAKDEKIRRLTLFSFLMCTAFFLVISSAQTKLQWYDMPMFPFLAMIVATFIFSVFDSLRKNNFFHQSLSINVAPYVFLFLIVLPPYQQILSKTYLPQDEGDDKSFYAIGKHLQNGIRGKVDLNNQYLVYDGYNAHNRFYMKKLNAQGVKIGKKDWKLLWPDDIVMASQKNVKEYIVNNYDYERLGVVDNVTTYLINGRKAADETD